MPEGVVDLLEPVQVQEQEAALGAGAPGLGQGVGRPAQQQGAVGQPGQLVVQRLILPVQRHGRVGVDRAERQQEQQEQQHRAVHRHDHQRRRGQQGQGDERLVRQGPAQRGQQGRPRVQGPGHTDQHEVAGEVGGRGQADGAQLAPGRDPGPGRRRVDVRDREDRRRGGQAEGELGDVEERPEGRPARGERDHQRGDRPEHRGHREAPVEQGGEAEGHRDGAGVRPGFARRHDPLELAEQGQGGDDPQQRLLQQPGDPRARQAVHGDQEGTQPRHRDGGDVVPERGTDPRTDVPGVVRIPHGVLVPQPAGDTRGSLSRVRRKPYFAKPIAHYPLRSIAGQQRFRRSEAVRH